MCGELCVDMCMCTRNYMCMLGVCAVDMCVLDMCKTFTMDNRSKQVVRVGPVAVLF